MHKKDFYSDDQATMLLRGLYFGLTNVSASLGDADKKDEEADVVKLLSAAEIRNAVYKDDDVFDTKQNNDNVDEVRASIS